MKKISVPRWANSASLDLIYQLNEQCLELLALAASRGDIGALVLLQRLQKLWRELDSAARQRAACVPVVLVNVHFNNARWWQDMRVRVMENRLVTDRLETQGQLGSSFIGEVLNHIWHMAHADPRLAALTFGVCPKVASVIGAMDMRDVRAVAALYGLETWLRWKDALKLWKRLLLAAVHGNKDVLAAVHLQIQLLLCGELLRPGR